MAGAIPRASYAKAIETGLQVGPMRRNHSELASVRALEACSTYDIESVSLVARKPV